MIRRLCLVAVVLVAAAACAGGNRREDVEQKLRERVRSGYVEPFRAGDVDRWLEVFADDATALHDTLPALRGRAAIRGFGEAVRDHFEIRQFDIVVDEVRTDGRWAVTIGHYTAQFVPRGPDASQPDAAPRKGKFLLLWERRQARWQVIADMGNTTSEAPAAGSTR
jgi:uncharacterized protein (TIGR02246 family)